MNGPLPLVLASASPRRRELLAQAGVTFTVLPVDVDESLEGFDDPERAAVELALRKARACVRSQAPPPTLPPASPARAMVPAAKLAVEPGSVALGADTIVAVREGARWRLLGKPADAREAGSMLELLSGSRHVVVTGVAAVRFPDGAERSACERTFVTMRAITADERAAYVASGEWEGKAGGYAIQETADRFVVKLEEGGFDNVVGLPVALALRLWRELGTEPGSTANFAG